MEKKPPRPMTPFDELVIPQQLHMLKLMLPYTPSSNQQFLGVFIKFLELKETIAFFQNFRNDLHTQAFSNEHPPTIMGMLGELKPYMPPQEAEMMDTFLNMMNIMEMVQMFQGNGGDTSENPFADMMGAFTSGGSTDGGEENIKGSGFQGMGNMGNMADMFTGGFNPMDMMMGMLTPEQQNMFQMYNSMFAQGMDTPENEEDMDSSDVSNSEMYNYETDSPEAEDPEMKGDNIYERMDEQSGNEEY